MFRRRLNIASIVCLCLCVAVLGIWIRSYWWIDSLTYNRVGSSGLVCGSAVGRLAIGVVAAVPPKVPFIQHSQIDNVASQLVRIGQHWTTIAGFGIDLKDTNCVVMVPHWFVVLVVGAVGFLPWSRVKYRFGLRTLFTATTFLAVVLGMIAWLDRAWIGK
jgi:hypothetical protein